jgi:hypothetical protein
MPDDRLERITNTLLENITYFSSFAIMSAALNDKPGEMKEGIEVRIETTYSDIWYSESGIGISIALAKNDACRKIATRIIEGTD